jgi:hypothetical protein
MAQLGGGAENNARDTGNLQVISKVYFLFVSLCSFLIPDSPCLKEQGSNSP